MSEAKPIEFDTDFYFSAEKLLAYKLEEIGNYTIKAKHSEYGPTSIGEKDFIVFGS